MKKQELTPEKMSVICTIQMLQENTPWNVPFTFVQLSKMDIEFLYEVQENLIEKYNKQFNS